VAVLAVSDTSAEVVTVIGAGTIGGCGSGSGVVDDTEPVTVKGVVRSAGMVTGKVTAGVPPTGIGPANTHVTVDVPVHVQLVAKAPVARVTPAGSVTTTVASAAWDGPALVTVAVNVPVLVPAVRMALGVRASVKSAEATTAVVVEALFGVVGSMLFVVSDAVTVAGAGVSVETTAATMASTEEVSGATEAGLVQVTT
jgi:hypothetical protein